MTCLFLSYENPFTFDVGDHIYTVNVLKALSKLNCTVDIVYFDSNKDEPVNRSSDLIRNTVSIKYIKKSLWKFLFTTKPASIVNRYSKEYIENVKSILAKERYDVIFINHFKMTYMIEQVNKILNSQKNNDITKTVFISHNVEYLLDKSLSLHQRSPIKKLAYFIDSIKTKRFEQRLLQQFSSVSAICENDYLFFKDVYGLQDAFIIRPVIQLDTTDHHDASLGEKSWSDAIVAGFEQV